jgi:hypothetical protein
MLREPERPRHQHWAALMIRRTASIIPIVLALAGLQWFVGGPSAFGAAFCAVTLMSLLVPTVSAHSIAVAAVSAIVIVAISSEQSPNVQVFAVQLAFAMGVIAPSLVVGRRSMEVRSVVSATVTLLAMAWLAAPVWTSRYGSLSQPFIDLHPLIVVNGLLAPTDAWTHRPAMYTLTSLGQDRAYQMPTSGWPCAAMHAGIAMPFMVIAAVGRSRRARIPS